MKKLTITLSNRGICKLPAIAVLAGITVGATCQAAPATLTSSFQSFPPEIRNEIKHVIIIYPENRSFDSLYGYYPCANGFSNATDYVQYGRHDGQPLANLIQPTTTGMSLITAGPDTRFPATLPNQPYDTTPYVSDNFCIGDMTHLFYLEQYQINNPAYTWISNDPKNAGGPLMSKFSVWSSNPGLVMSFYDEQNGGEGVVAKEFVMADNCFHSAFGGSFLNHQFLIAARAPVWPATPAEGGPPTGSTRTPMDTNSPAGYWWPAANGVTAGYGNTLSDNALTPDPTLPGFPYSNNRTNLTAGDYWAVNTLRPLHGPAGGYAVPASAPYLNLASQNYGMFPTTNGLGTGVAMLPAPFNATAISARLPLQYHDTIGDRLNDAGVSWAWFSGGWNDAKAGTADYLFQFHHQPFAFFANYALAAAPVYPTNGTSGIPTPGVDSIDPSGRPVGFGLGSANHLLDEDADFYRMLDDGTLPQVSFVKPIGEDNSHPGYASVKRGQAWIANIMSHIKRSSLWPHTVVFICYDEHGGLWDHVTPPVIDRWGPGLRVPFIIASPFSKKGFVDHNQYETVSMLAFIEGLYGVSPLNTRDANALPPVAAFAGQPDLFVEAKVGQPVSYKIPAYNKPEIYFLSTGHLGGLVLDKTTGVISGTPTKAGTYTACVTVHGSQAGLPAGHQNLCKYEIEVNVTK